MTTRMPVVTPTPTAAHGAAARQSASLRSQIALAFGALVVALGLLLSAAMGEMLKQRIQKDAGASLHIAARNASKLLTSGLQERAREAWVLAQSQPLWAQGLDAPQVLQALERSQAMQPHSLWIGATDLDGVVRASTGDLLRGQTVRERPWFGAGLKGLHVGDVHPAKLLARLLPPNIEGEPQRFVDFAAPIQSGGKTIGALAIHGSWDWTREVMEGLLPETSSQRALELLSARTEQLQAANAELALQARSDPLTGLLNRRGLDAQFAFALALARRSGRPLSLVSVDVDHFKRINDTYGHAQGDQVLQHLAQTLQQRVRSSDLVARLGGEEFVALLPDTDIASAHAVAEELRMAVAAQQHPVVGSIRISIGISMLRPGEDTPTALLERADAALYEAKRQGRNRVCVQA